MSDITAQEIRNLQEQKGLYESRLAGLDINNPIQAAEHSGLTDELNVVTNKIAELMYNQEQQEAVIEDKVNNTDIPFAMSGVDMSNLPAPLIKMIDTIVRADRKAILRPLLVEHAEEIKTLQGQIQEDAYQMADYLQKIEQLQKDDEESDAQASAMGAVIDSLQFRMNETEEEVAQLRQDKADLTSKLANAAAQLDEQKTLVANAEETANQLAEALAEIERLKSHVLDLQAAQSLGEAEAQKVIKIDQSDADEINKALKEYLAMDDTFGTLVKVTDAQGQQHIVPSQEFRSEWVPVTPPPIGGSNDTGTFQGDGTETATTGAENSGVPASEVGESFPTPPVSNVDFARGRDTADGEMVEESRSVIQRLADIEARVSRLEQGSADTAEVA